MATVLVVDDHALNRELVVTLLRHRGHRPIEAADGAEALALARRERPDLIIADILMPTMDGFELVRRLRLDPELARTEVIFHTAHYHEREARNLAASCGVKRILLKPTEPEDILRAVDEALAREPVQAPPPDTRTYDREHVRLVTDKLSEKVSELTAANQRMATLTQVNLQLASEREPRTLLENVCRHARDLLGARYAILCVHDRQMLGGVLFTASGFDPAAFEVLERPGFDAGPFARILEERRSQRWSRAGQTPWPALPGGWPRASSALASPIVSLTTVYGWICMIDKVGRDDGFTEDEEQILATLAAQVGRVYENGNLYAKVREHAARLEAEVAERKAAEASYRASEERARRIVDAALDAFIAMDSGGRIVEWNPQAEAVFGWPRKEVIGRSLAETIVPQQLRGPHRAGLERFLASGDGPALNKRIELTALHRKGHEFPVELGITAIRLPDGFLFGGYVRDITSRMHLERELHESDAGLRRAQRLAHLGHVVTLADGTFEAWSETLPQLIGVEPAHVPKSGREWMGMVHEDDRALFRATAIEAGRTGVRIEVEYRVVHPDGNIARLRQVMDPIVGTTRWFCTLQDVTEQRQAVDALHESERRLTKLNADLELRVAERTMELQKVIAELEAFDRSITHDLRAPIRHVQGFTSLLIEEYSGQLDERGIEYLARITNSALRLDRLVTDLFSLSTLGREALSLDDVDVSALVRSVIEATAGADASRAVEWHVDPGLTVRADAGLLRIALENLIGNAFKYTSKQPRARIEFGRVAGPMPAYFVRDNGAGFDMAFAGRLFAPFQRLHGAREFEGTGIGLATVQRIVQRHGGRAWAEAAPGKGATFFFTLDSPEPAC